MLLGGGGRRGGGGRTIMGGLDLSITVAPPEGVRERVMTSSTALESVDSMDCLLSEVEVRGRDKKEAPDSRCEGEGAATMGKDVVVGPADGGGEINWNCCEGGPTRKGRDVEGLAGVDGDEMKGAGRRVGRTGAGAGGVHWSV